MSALTFTLVTAIGLVLTIIAVELILFHEADQRKKAENNGSGRALWRIGDACYEVAGNLSHMQVEGIEVGSVDHTGLRGSLMGGNDILFGGTRLPPGWKLVAVPAHAIRPDVPRWR